jgi:hypothetical protein
MSDLGEGEGSQIDHQTVHSIPSTSTLHREQGNPERGTESSSITSRHLPPLFTLCCNPLILGALEYKDHQLLDVGTELAQTRINYSVFTV